MCVANSNKKKTNPRAAVKDGAPKEVDSKLSDRGGVSEISKKEEESSKGGSRDEKPAFEGVRGTGNYRLIGGSHHSRWAVSYLIGSDNVWKIPGFRTVYLQVSVVRGERTLYLSPGILLQLGDVGDYIYCGTGTQKGHSSEFIVCDSEFQNVQTNSPSALCGLVAPQEAPNLPRIQRVVEDFGRKLFAQTEAKQWTLGPIKRAETSNCNVGGDHECFQLLDNHEVDPAWKNTWKAMDVKRQPVPPHRLGDEASPVTPEPKSMKKKERKQKGTKGSNGNSSRKKRETPDENGSDVGHTEPDSRKSGKIELLHCDHQEVPGLTTIDQSQLQTVLAALGAGFGVRGVGGNVELHFHFDGGAGKK